jgi:hypothetical protein
MGLTLQQALHASALQGKLLLLHLIAASLSTATGNDAAAAPREKLCHPRLARCPGSTTSFGEA